VLPYIYDWSLKRIEAFRQEANAWTVHAFSGDQEFWREANGCVMFTCELAVPAIDEYDRVPLLFARLDQPGIKQRCIHQLQSAPLERHERQTIRVMVQDLKADFDAMNDDGTNMSDALSREVRCKSQ